MFLQGCGFWRCSPLVGKCHQSFLWWPSAAELGILPLGKWDDSALACTEVEIICLSLCSMVQVLVWVLIILMQLPLGLWSDKSMLRAVIREHLGMFALFFFPSLSKCCGVHGPNPEQHAEPAMSHWLHPCYHLLHWQSEMPCFVLLWSIQARFSASCTITATLISAVFLSAV